MNEGWRCFVIPEPVELSAGTPCLLTFTTRRNATGRIVGEDIICDLYESVDSSGA